MLNLTRRCTRAAHLRERARSLRACFVIAPTGTKLEPLTRIVKDAGWRVLNLESVDPGAAVYLATATQLIESADAVIVVLTGQDSPSTLIETGLAIGRRRPVLLVAEDAAITDGLTPDRVLTSLPRVRARLADTEALRFHIGAFLDGFERRQANNSLTPVTPRATPEHRSARTTRPATIYSRLEGRLLDAFEKAPEIEAVHLEPQLDGGERFRPDFALWLRDTRLVLPNPLIVDVVGHEGVRRGSSRRRLDQLRRYAFDTGVGAVMLVEEVKAQPLSLLGLSPMIYRIGLLDLEGLLESNRLVPEMIRARNFLAHSAG